MDDLIKYFEDKLTLLPSDLMLEDSDRMILIGQLSMLDEIKEISLKGFPDDNTEEDTL